jgi:DNA modification methylase
MHIIPKIQADGIPVYCAFEELADVATLIPNPRNLNQHGDKQINLLAKIIKNQGWRAPITVSNRSGFVVRGHGRLLAAQSLGVSQVPVDCQDYATEAEEWADLIADNRIAELAEMDDSLLAGLLAEFGDMDVELDGFSAKEVDQMLAELDNAEVVEDDFDAAAEAAKIKTPVTQPGGIWQLGRQRLMCGDSTALADVQKLMDGQLADMIFTDPPYNVNYQGSTAEQLTIKNDNMSADQFNAFLQDAFAAMLAVAAPGAAIYVCHADSEGANFRGALQDASWLLKQCLIWVKNQFVIGRQDYQWRHEPILYGWKPGAAHRWYGGRKQGTVIEDSAPLVIQRDNEGALLNFTFGLQTVTLRVPSFEILQAGGDELSTAWRFEKPLRNGEHPTMKPIGLCARAIANSSKPGENVGDFFGGSGSTLIAAEQVGRSAYVMEVDPVYCDVIVKRWEEFTGQRALRITESKISAI